MLTRIQAKRLIDLERVRQRVTEGYTLRHDDEHKDSELLHAALIYLHHGTDFAAKIDETGRPEGWPWDAADFKPKDRKSNLVRAGALMLAERERLFRANPQADVEHVNHKLDLCIRHLQALK